MTYRNIIIAFACILLSVSSAQAAVYTLTPHISISEEYTDNRNLTDKNPIEEYSTIISPGIDQSIVGKHVGMDLSYTASYVQYNTTDSDPIWNHDATIDFRADLSKHTQLSIADGYTRTDQPLRTTAYNLIGYVQIGDRLIPVADTTLLKDRRQYDTNSAYAEFAHQFGEQDSFSLHYSHSFIKELESKYGVNNQRQASGIDITYWLTSQFGVDVSAQYVLAELENSDNFNEKEGGVTFHHKLSRHSGLYLSYNQILHRFDSELLRNYDLYKSSVGISYEIDKNLSMTLGGGYFYQEMKESEEKDEGPFADISIQKVWSSKRSSGYLRGKAGLGTNNFGSENLGFNRNYGFAMTYSYKLTKQLNVDIDTSFFRHESLEKDNLKYNKVLAGLGFSLAPVRWLSISASYSFHFLSSTRETDDYEENTAILNISIIPWAYRNNY